MPREGVVYRCQICRLELVADLTGSKLTVAPFPTEDPTPRKEPA